MVSVTEAQLLAWTVPLLWPFLRLLALLSALPVLGTRTVPMRVRIALAGFVALAAQPALPPMLVVALDTPVAFALVAQQVLVGLAIGFAVRVVFAAVEYAGEFVGLQMGLNFAGFFDPVSAAAGTATGRLYGTMVAWLFVVVDGHLLVIAALVQSFEAFPAGPQPFDFLRQTLPHQWGAELFQVGLWVALPVLTMLLFVNLVLGLVSRVAPQINIFAIGFPVTLGIGLLGMLATLPLLAQPFTLTLQRLLEQLR